MNPKYIKYHLIIIYLLLALILYFCMKSFEQNELLRRMLLVPELFK